MATEEGHDDRYADDGNRNLGQKPGPVKLSEEEIAVLKECRRTSLYYRGLPLGVISALVTRQVAHSGYFPRVAKWSGLFYSCSFMFGVISGVASYRKICMEKIMKLENSVLADQFRDFQEQRKAILEGRKIDPERRFANNKQRQSNSSSYNNDEDPSIQYEADINEMEAEERPRSEPRSQRGLSYEDIRTKHRMNQSVPSQPSSVNNNDSQASLDFDRTRHPKRHGRPSGQSYSSDDGNTYVNRTNRYQSNERISSNNNNNSNDELAYANDDDGINRKAGFKKTNQYGDPIE